MKRESPILETVRAAVEKITHRNLHDIGADLPLKLDSLSRITLVLELENRFEMELDSDSLLPEVFDTLGSLAAFIDQQRRK